MKNKSAVALGKKSAEKRGMNSMTPAERSQYMKDVRAKKTPTLPILVQVSQEIN